MNAIARPARPGRRLLQAILLATTLAGLLGCDDPTTPADAVATVSVEPASLALGVGDTVTLRAVARTASGDTVTGHPIVWSSGDTARATVSPGGRVTARAGGPVTITASTAGRSGQALLTIAAPAPLAPVIQDLQPAEVAAGGQAITLTINGAGFQPDAIVQWNGSGRPTTYVSATLVRAAIPSDDIAHPGGNDVRVVNPGNGTATAPARFLVVAQANPVTRLDVRPTIAVTSVGAYVPLAATPFDLAGHPLTDRLVTYSSSNQLVATVDANGRVTPVGPGEVLITARSEGVEATSAISVHGGTTFHLLASDGVGLASLDLRLGTPPARFWQHWAGSRAIEPSPSPDGRFVVYTIEDVDGGESHPWRRIAILDRANRTYQVVANTGRADRPAWSPAGDRIAFRHVIDGQSHIFTVRPDGTGLTNLTADLPDGSNALDPAWSPDGARIVFAVRDYPGFTGLMTMNADGTGKYALTWGNDTQPAWIGDLVVFTRRDPAGSGSDIWRTSVSGVTPVLRLTTTGTAHSPAWSPDQRWIAFVDGGGTGRGAIMAMRPLGEDVRPISLPADGPAGGGLDPVWIRHQ